MDAHRRTADFNLPGRIGGCQLGRPYGAAPSRTPPNVGGPYPQFGPIKALRLLTARFAREARRPAPDFPPVAEDGMYHHAMWDSAGPFPTAFEVGSHLRVRRPDGSTFHGIYVSDASVIELGGEQQGKWTATMREVPLGAFERGGMTQVVAHSRKPRREQPSWARSGEWIIGRARSLIANYTPGRYDRIGNDCEDLANWCATGVVTKGVRVLQGCIALALVVDLVDLIVLVVVYPDRPRPALVSAWIFLSVALMLIALAGAFWYILCPFRRWRDIADRAGGN